MTIERKILIFILSWYAFADFLNTAVNETKTGNIVGSFIGLAIKHSILIYLAVTS